MQVTQKKQMLWLILSFAIIVADQISKYFVVAYLEFAQPVVVFPFFNFTLLHNTGAAFGFLNTASGWQTLLFAGISIVISTLLCVWLYRLPEKQTLTAIALALILGGALGNLWDRISLGYVIDFLSFHVNNWYFAVFNIADAAISIGAALMIADLFLSERH